MMVASSEPRQAKVRPLSDCSFRASKRIRDPEATLVQRRRAELVAGAVWLEQGAGAAPTTGHLCTGFPG